MTTRFCSWLVFLPLVLPACGVDPASVLEDPAAALLPDGATGIARIQRGGHILEVPWVARSGLEWVDDDFAIGPALANVPYAATTLTLGKWANDRVPFCIHLSGADAESAADAALIRSSLRGLEAITPMHFDEFTCGSSAQPTFFLDYRHRIDDGSNVTTGGIGHDGNTIQFTGTLTDHIVTHETGHALGYMHEQKRPDRQNYVIYTPACLDDPEKDSQFVQITSTPDELTPYDRVSVMEYGSFNYSSNHATCPTLTWGNPDPAHASWGGVFVTPTGQHILGEEIIGKQPWSEEDINATYQLYEPVLGTPEQNDRFGAAMVAADFDGDGYDDLAVGAIGEQVGSGHGGAVLLYKGTMNGLVAWKVLQETDFSGVTARAGDQFGATLAAGDLDHDGIADLIVGAPFYGNPAGGAVFAYLGRHLGRPLAVGTANTQSSTGAGANEASDMFGASIAFGHFAGGTTGYIAVGAPFEHISGFSGSRGMVSILRWTGSGFTQRENLHPSDVGISVASGQFGAALATGDFDNDGADDLIVGAPADLVGTGAVASFFGDATAMVAGSALVPSDTLATDDRFGTSVAAGRDGGGAWVVAAGAPGHAGPGRVYKFIGLGGRALTQIGSLQQSQIAGESGHTGDGFGESVAALDYDGDNQIDFLVGAPGKPINGSFSAGEIAVFASHSAARVIAPTAPSGGDSFGRAFAVGNFDRGAHSPGADTRNDLAVGLPGRTVNGVANAGKADIYQGASLTLWRQIVESTSRGPF
jgi:hypothetical protein